MANPQQPELRRSERNEARSPDATEARQEAQRDSTATADHGPVPEGNRAGHHDEHEQDKPDLDAFAERLGIVPPDQEPAADQERVVDREPEVDDAARRAPQSEPSAGGRPGWAVVARVGSLVVLEPWIVAGRVAERLRGAIEARLDGEAGG